jgi:AcrR family transcriptional regulator
MATFQRARSEEQREVRRRAILDAAAAMLAEMPVAQVSLNELSRRVGLAKSNVLRYFESREAVLLELLDSAWQEWLAGLAEALGAAAGAGAAGDAGGLGAAGDADSAGAAGDADSAGAAGDADSAGAAGDADSAGAAGDADSAGGAGGSPDDRGDQLAAELATSLASRPVLCDLISAQAAVLERNVSPQVAAQYKRAAVANVTALSRLVLACVGELGEHGAGRFAAATVLVAGAVWPYAQPSAAMLAAYQADPALASMRLDFTATLREVLETLIAGLLARSSGPIARAARPIYRPGISP